MDAVEEWVARGERVPTRAGEVFVVDVPPARAAGADPLLVLHGFPTSSFDFHLVVADLARSRRVVLIDLPGFGCSDKPDVRYSIRRHADAAQDVVARLGLATVDLLTHDMGDTVGGELLARDLEGGLPFRVGRRVLTNGSIYLGMAQLTAGQQMLLARPDARFDLASVGIDPAEGFKAGVAGTFAPHHEVPARELDAAWRFAAMRDGHTLLARTIRYIEDRRAEEERFTGAIERHPSPLGVVWGALDPVAVVAMTTRLLAARPDATLVVLDDVGHYPMLEAPARFSAAVLGLLA
ncbi:MAG: putative hydrolase LipZ [Acidimicrobiia bacterium]|nr:MAG: putative hydrolase LipZ [Acidimicrobiia bacterium]